MIKAISLSERAQEVLEKCWIENKEIKSDWKMDVVYDDPLFAELTEGKYATSDESHFTLTEKGWEEARSCVRRHRLAECLLTDVLDIQKEMVHEIGCKFEHALQKNVEENICTLLGHPKRCPHDKPIPDGECCRTNKRNPRKLALPLSECEVGEKAKVAYIAAHNGTTMNKLIAMGVLPGLSIQLLRKTPSYLFQMGESQFAIDRELAEKIHVRLLQ